MYLPTKRVVDVRLSGVRQVTGGGMAFGLLLSEISRLEPETYRAMNFRLASALVMAISTTWTFGLSAAEETSAVCRS